MIGYVKCFDSNKTMSFKVIDNKLLKWYTKIWEKVTSLMNIEFDNEPVYGDNDKYIKTPKWLKNKKATIDPKNNDNKCFQYAVAVALNH